MAGWREPSGSLARQLRDGIWQLLQTEGYRPGDQLPSEQELVARFQVSRGTLREALKLLEEERVIICQHGVGRFVAPDPSDILSDDITRLKSVTELAHSLGFCLQTKVLSVCKDSPGPVICDHLGLQPVDPVVVLERVRYAANEPLIYSIDVFSCALAGDGLDSEDYAGSLLSRLEKAGRAVAYSKTLISAVQLGAEFCARIGTPGQVSWILMEQINYDAEDRPLLYSKDYHRGDKFQFKVLRRRR